jgi:hypothetical protein
VKISLFSPEPSPERRLDFAIQEPTHGYQPANKVRKFPVNPYPRDLAQTSSEKYL